MGPSVIARHSRRGGIGGCALGSDRYQIRGEPYTGRTPGEWLLRYSLFVPIVLKNQRICAAVVNSDIY